MAIHALTTSAAVPAGTLTLQAWDSLRAASLVIGAAVDDPTANAVRGAGIAVATPTEPAGDDLRERLASRGGDVIWLAPRGESAPAGITELIGSADPDGVALLRLVDVMGRLRRECPWDARQTHDSLAPHLLEESYEVLDAIAAGDSIGMCEELGDVLFQVYFHAQLASERGRVGWTVDDVAGGLIDKLVHRHPHVFAGITVRDAAEVEANWDRLKATEKQRDSVLDGIPSALPALAYADKVMSRLQRAGKLYDELPEPDGDAQSRLGRELLRMVMAARAEGLDAEGALRDAAQDLARRTEG